MSLPVPLPREHIYYNILRGFLHKKKPLPGSPERDGNQEEAEMLGAQYWERAPS
jgi:hypothetical protein